jgi:hypothetical protein
MGIKFAMEPIAVADDSAVEARLSYVAQKSRPP